MESGPQVRRPETQPRNENISNEQKALREKLVLALVKLKKIISTLPPGSREFRRATHTLKSIEGAMAKLGKGGAPKDKYRVRDETNSENSQVSYFQHEGIPVDELIDILKSTAQEINSSSPDRRIEAREMKDLADKLSANSVGYFETHYTKEHGEDPSVWTEEQRKTQDWRTKKEAKLISLDYRATGSEEGDYKAAMEILKHRRELKLPEEVPTEPAQPIIIGAPAAPVAVVQPDNTAGPRVREKKKFKTVIVDTTDVMKAQARDAGDAAMTMEAPEDPNAVKGFKKFFKGEFYKRAGQKIWKHGLWRDYYRNKATGEARKAILGSKNIFAAEGGDQAAHDKFVKDVMEQFTSEYEKEVIHDDAGEFKRKNEEIKNEPEAKEKVKKLIIDYATGRIPEEAFREQEARIFSKLKTDNDLQQLRKKEDVMHASNLWAIAEQIKEAMRVGEFLENEDFDIDLIYGKSKAGVRTEAKFTGAEKLAEKLSHTKLGSLINETTAAAGFAIATSLAQKLTQTGTSVGLKLIPIVGFFGSAAISSYVAKVREAKKVEEERRQHAREMAKGETFDPAKMERRKEMEESRYKTEKAVDIINSLAQSNEVLRGNTENLTPEVLRQTLAGLAKVEARIRLSDKRSIDLLSYSDTTKVVEERRNLDIERAKMKVALRKLFEAGRLPPTRNPQDIDTFRGNEPQNFEGYLYSLATTEENILTSGDMSAKDRIFNKMKSKRSNQAAWKGFKTGLIIGTTMQEVMALATGQTGLAEDIYHQIKGTPTFSGAGTEHFTSLAYLKNYLEGNLPPVGGGGGALHEAFAGSSIKLPDGTSMTPNGNGSYNLLSGNRVVAQHLTINPDGTFTGDAENILRNGGVNINNNLINGTAQQNVTIEEYVKNHSASTHEMHRSWYDNDTPASDRNELRTHWGGEKGTGIDVKGNYVLDVSHMTPDGSSHAGLSANAQELLKAGDLKMLVSLSEGTQHQVFEIPINSNGQIIVDPNSEIGRLAFANVGGHAEFLGRFGEIGQDLENNNFRMLSTIEGKGLTNMMDTVSTNTHETILNIPDAIDSNYELPPFIPLVPRTPLEKLKKKERQPDQSPRTPVGLRDNTSRNISNRRQNIQNRLDNPLNLISRSPVELRITRPAVVDADRIINERRLEEERARLLERIQILEQEIRRLERELEIQKRLKTNKTSPGNIRKDRQLRVKIRGLGQELRETREEERTIDAQIVAERPGPQIRGLTLERNPIHSPEPVNVERLIRSNVSDDDLDLIRQEFPNQDPIKVIEAEVVEELNIKTPDLTVPPTRSRIEKAIGAIRKRQKNIVLSLMVAGNFAVGASFKAVPSAEARAYDKIKVESLTDLENMIIDQEAINKLDNLSIINKANENSGKVYLVVDKSAGFAHLYKNGNLIKSYEVGVGEQKGDDQTVTVVRNGKAYWSEGNRQTGAGIHTVNKRGVFEGAPSFTLTNERGIEIPTAFHRVEGDRAKLFNDNNPGNNRMSNGCLNFMAGSLEDLAKQDGFEQGTKVYILPDDPHNKFEMIDGGLRFSSNQQNVNRTIKLYEPRPTILMAENPNEDGKTFLQTLGSEENKRKMMSLYPTVSNSVYNELAKITYGIFGQESSFGTYGGFRGQSGRMADVAGSTIGNNVSVGVTQIRMTSINPKIREAFGIYQRKDLYDVRKAALGTLGLLLDIYTTNIPANQKEDYRKLVPLAYNSPKKFKQALKTDQPIKSAYVAKVLRTADRVKAYGLIF